MYRKILIPVDGSVLAECTFEHLKTIVTICNPTQVELITVVGLAEHILIEGGASKAELLKMRDRYEVKAKEYLLETGKKLKSQGINAKGVIVNGNPAEGIIDYAEKNNFDLVIMSTHGRSGIGRWFLGSVTEKVLRYCKVPVLIVTPKNCQVLV
jgi:nucleotide-binding universal stress UspA family protein